VDEIFCGPGRDRVVHQPEDFIAADCERRIEIPG
jgi:hypothetical protein